jgi:hypothetical protein
MEQYTAFSKTETQNGNITDWKEYQYKPNGLHSKPWKYQNIQAQSTPWPAKHV